MKLLTAALVLVAAPSFAQYQGFGASVIGGDNQPTCLVSNTAGTGAGSFSECARKGNVKVIFNGPGPFLVDGQNTYINSNTTIDGCANGQNGVTLDQPSDIHRSIVFEAGPGGSSSGPGNIKIQCIRFQGHGKSAGATTEADLLSFDGTNGPIVGVLVDRCTFTGATDGALDITGNVSEVTVSHALFYNNPLTQLIKYGGSNDGASGAVGHDMSLHHNVYSQNGERNPQIRDGQTGMDLVSNVVGPAATIVDFEANQPYSKFGTLLWDSSKSGEGPAGNVRVNVTNSAYLGLFDTGPNDVCLQTATATTGIGICSDAGANPSGIYIAGNYCSSGPCMPSQAAGPNPIPAAAVVTPTLTGDLKASLSAVGAPNRSAADQAALDASAALLPGPSPVPSPTPSPTPSPVPTPTPTPVPSPTPTPKPSPTPIPSPIPPPAPIPAVTLTVGQTCAPQTSATDATARTVTVKRVCTSTSTSVTRY